VTESIFHNVTAERLFNLTPQPDTENNEGNISNYLHVSRYCLSEYCNNIIVYVSGYVVKKLLRKVNCPDCALSLVEENEVLEHSLFLSQRDKGGLKKPSKDVVSVCTFTEKCIRSELAVCKGKLRTGNIGNRITTLVLKHTLEKPVFLNLSSHVLESLLPENHVLSLIKAIVKEFLNLRFHHLSKTNNISLKGKNVRQKLTKIVLFKNQ
jgi:hypothetical protein